MPPFIPFLLGGFVLYVLWRACQPRWLIKIVARPESKPTMQGIPHAKLLRIEEFFERDIKLPCDVTIYIHKEQGGRLRTRFQGKLDQGLQQRIRNALYDILR